MVERSGGIYFALVKISNDSNVDSPRDLEAKMTFPNGSGFKGKVTSANFGKIKAGTTVTRMFKYKTRKAKVKSTVPVTITVYFAGQISAQKVYKVKVVREICDESDPFCF